MSGSDEAAMTARIAEIGGWRGETLARVRAAIGAALPDVVEAMKWKKPSNPAGVPTFLSRGGNLICTADALKDKVKVTFAKGALLDDPAGVFNNGLGGNAFRAIDLREGEWLDEAAFGALVRGAAR